MKSSYDCVVIGNTIGGLITAGILLRKKKRVLLLKTIPWESQADGVVLEHGPPVLWGLSAGRNLEKGLREMNVPVYKMRGIMPVEPAMQLLLPDHRISFPPKQEQILEALGRYHSVGEEGLRALLEALSQVRKTAMERLNLAPDAEPKGLWDRTKRKVKTAMEDRMPTLTKAAESAGLPPSLIHDLNLLLLPFSQLYHPQGDFHAAIGVLAHPQLDTFYFEGRRSGFLTDLAEMVKEMGGDVAGAEVKYVFAEGNRVKAVDLHEGNGPIQARSYVWAAGYLQFARVAGEDPVRSRIASFFLAPKYVRLSIHFRVLMDVVPVGIGPYLACHLGEEPPGAKSSIASPDLKDWTECFLLAVHPTSEMNEVPVTATVFLPAEDMEKFETAAAHARDQVLRRLHDLMPFAEGKIRCVGWHDSLTFARNFLGNTNVVYRMDPKHEDSPVGLTLRSHWSNLFFAAPEIFPYWGLDGEALAGRLAARACLRVLAA
ncbi:MAG: hypothetical protein HYT87_03975 [Nitrospirae bacterium]|nr:hypothetical protein [Nitrospirota bacterium]